MEAGGRQFNDITAYPTLRIKINTLCNIILLQMNEENKVGLIE